MSAKDFESLVKSLKYYRDAKETPDDWMAREADATVDDDVCWNQVAFDMALHVAELAYQAGLKDRKTGVWKADGEVYKEGFDEGFDAAAKDRRAWYLKDKNGEPLHLFDKAKTSDGIVMISAITADIDPMKSRVLGCDDSGGWEHKPWKIEKVTPDTREKIINDLAKLFREMRFGTEDETLDAGGNDLAEEFVSRVEGLSQ